MERTGDLMRETSPLSQMIESLERVVAFHKEREAFHGQQQEHHAKQEKLHGGERSRHAAELEAAVRHLEELRSMSDRVGEVLKTRTLPMETDAQSLGRHPNLSKALDRVLATWSPEIPITASEMATEISRRFGALLGRNVDPRVLGAALRRRRDKGLLREESEGRPFQEAVYRVIR
jgi:hypothetical protein